MPAPNDQSASAVGSSTIGTLKRPLLIVLVAALAVLAVPATAAAKTPCWKQLVNDYFTDNRIDRVYPLSCYRAAMNSLPRDAQEYSDAEDQLRRALLAAIRKKEGGGKRGGDNPPSPGGSGQGPGDGSGGGPGAGGSGNGNDPPASAADPIDEDGSEARDGFFVRALDKLGPKNADSVPVPLLVLASIALLLFGAAAASYLARWLQARRVQVAPAPAPPTERQ